MCDKNTEGSLSVSQPVARIVEERVVVERVYDLRDYFAGKALVGYLSDSNTPSPEETAKWCYRYADAMLKAREIMKGDPNVL